MEENVDIYKIPAFQRRANISARARKVSRNSEKRVVIPAGRVQPFPQVIDRRPSIMKAADTNRPVFGQPLQKYTRMSTSNLKEESLSARNRRLNRDRDTLSESSLYGSHAVSKTVMQKVQDRMEKDQHYNENYDEAYFEEPLPSLRRMECIGIATMFFDKIQVVVIDLIKPMRLGDRLIFEQADNCLFEEEILSMQANKKDIKRARSGQEVGIKLELRPKLGGKVWKVVA